VNYLREHVGFVVIAGVFVVAIILLFVSG